MSKGQAPSLVGVVVGSVLALIIGVIVIYAVAFPVLVQTNSSYITTVNASSKTGTMTDFAFQQTNWATIMTLVGVMAIIIALVVFMTIARMAG